MLFCDHQLMFLASQFAFRPDEKILSEAGDGSEVRAAEVVVVFVQGEPQRRNRLRRFGNEVVKNVKWMAGKRRFKNGVLHSFTHLAWDLSVYGESLAKVFK